MKDLSDPNWIKIKGILFLLIGSLSAFLLFFEHPTLRHLVLLILCVWGFCRFYYFAFYVIQYYVDDTYRFSGLGSFLRYFFAKKCKSDSKKNEV
jgi:hypothetical protein